MAYRSFFDGEDDPNFDRQGRPKSSGVFEFRNFEGRVVLYTLDWMRREDGDPPVLKVIHATRIQDYPSPAHALKNLDGTWVRYIGPVPASDDDVEGKPKTDAEGDDAGSP